ncbi:MAG TPA: CarD family transcriptional regulator, partial [Methylomirabilota bacterium]|nr:CarD family transcriptional regulator [Methylomirabilota bacterium]
RRPIVAVTEDLKSQERFHQDLQTWRAAAPGILFYPAWEILPHEARLPHADVISDRLEALIALEQLARGAGAASPLLVTTLEALLQRTFQPADLRQRTRALKRGDRVDPLDLVEWLEAQGYEPEAQVTQKGEMALRGGILDLFPLTSPWPVRLEFFGDELESLRYFDPLTQISREEIIETIIPPAGELGILKKVLDQPGTAPAATLLEYLSPETILLVCEPDALGERADDYTARVPENDPLFASWADFLGQARSRGLTQLELTENDLVAAPEPNSDAPLPPAPLEFDNLDAFRPLADRAPEPQVAEAQRREFFAQLHRWSRQGFAVYVFCNNDGERERFLEVWEELRLDDSTPTPSAAATEAAVTPGSPGRPRLQLGVLSRGFLCVDARFVVVTDAEIFGRYKLQQPRRLKSPHAQATRSALDIDFAELEEGDYVVHLQHGIGRYLGLQVLPIGAGTKPTESSNAPAAAGQECLVIEYAPGDSSQPPPKLYVPVTEAHLVSKYVGTGKARPQLNTLGGTRWAKAKAQAERAVHDVASELLAIQAARESQAGHPFGPDTP